MQFLTVKRGLRCRQSCVVEIQVLASMNTVPDGLLLQTSDHRVLGSARVTWTTDSSFWEAAQSQVQWILTNPIRHGRETDNSKPFSDRLESGHFPRHGGQHVCAPQRVGDLLGLLFRILLEHVRETEYLHRCRVKPPKMCTDVRKFHTKHFKTFSQQFPTETIYPFLQVDVLYKLLFDYWNTDRELRVMCPFDPQRWVRCKAQWGDFWMTETELWFFVVEVVRRYRINCPSFSAQLPKSKVPLS